MLLVTKVKIKSIIWYRKRIRSSRSSHFVCSTLFLFSILYVKRLRRKILFVSYMYVLYTLYKLHLFYFHINVNSKLNELVLTILSNYWISNLIICACLLMLFWPFKKGFLHLNMTSYIIFKNHLGFVKAW